MTKGNEDNLEVIKPVKRDVTSECTAEMFRVSGGYQIIIYHDGNFAVIIGEGGHFTPLTTIGYTVESGVGCFTVYKEDK